MGWTTQQELGHTRNLSTSLVNSCLYKRHSFTVNCFFFLICTDPTKDIVWLTFLRIILWMIYSSSIAREQAPQLYPFGCLAFETTVKGGEHMKEGNLQQLYSIWVCHPCPPTQSCEYHSWNNHSHYTMSRGPVESSPRDLGCLHTLQSHRPPESSGSEAWSTSTSVNGTLQQDAYSEVPPS